MPLTEGRKVLLVGLDSITPVMVERFLAEGRMPSLARLRERGWSTEVTPTMPPTTPAGWATISTGAWPSTHGVEGFAMRRLGAPLDQKVHALSSDHVRCEQLWQALERQGLSTILLKFPMSWPPTGGGRVIQVDGAGGWAGLKCVSDLVHSGCWDTHATARPEAAEVPVGPQDWLTRDFDNLDEETVRPIEVRAVSAWTHLPASFVPRWEATLELSSHDGAGAAVHLLAGRDEGGDCLLLSSARDGADTRPIRQGEWSDWVDLGFHLAGAERRGSVRFKAMHLDVEDRRARLYQTQVHASHGFTRPEALAGELEAVAGPFVEWTESYDLLQGWIDDDTQLELYAQHVDWMTRAAVHLLREHRSDLFMAQLHIVDMAYHMYWGAVDPRHPEHDADRAPRYWDLLARVHELADAFLGAVLAEADDDTLVVVVGDHGHDLCHTAVMLNHVLVRAGLLALDRDRRTGAPTIDWARTKAFASSYRVYLNVRGRDPDGIVAPDDYEAVQQQVVEAVRAVRDPVTGQAPVLLAVRREDAASFGLYSEVSGDVVCMVASGYHARTTILLPRDAWIAGRLVADRVPELRPTRLFREFTGDHDTAAPFTRALQTMLVLGGPGIRRGRRRVPIDLVDVAPTLCHWLGVAPPSACEGRPALDAFAE